MKIYNFKTVPSELPFKPYLSFESMYKQFEVYANDDNHPYQKSSKEVLKLLKDSPEIIDGIDNLEDIQKYEEEIKLLSAPLFPDPLQLNEIKMLMVPFANVGFMPTKRFENIIDNAGPDFKPNMIGYDEDKMYLYACSYILGMIYHQNLGFSRPVFMEIPNIQTGKVNHYRALINGDFNEIIKTDKAPDLTQEDIDELLQQGENLELWKEKFPPNSYILKGFGIINLYNATQDVILSKIHSVFLRSDEKVIPEFTEHVRDLFGIPDLDLGYSIYNVKTKHTAGSHFKKASHSLFLNDGELMDLEALFCSGIRTCAMQNSEIIAIPDIELYGMHTKQNKFYKKIAAKGYKSVILVPIKINDEYVELIEVGSKRKNELNSINAPRFRDIIPSIKVASDRYFKQSQNVLESTIQENYTSIHPTVKWRFLDAVANYNQQLSSGEEDPMLEDIVFDKVYPLYGQSDIKGSSTARNTAIKEDLELQLEMVISTLNKICRLQNLPIYKNLQFRVAKYVERVKEGLKAGDEVNILEFLKREIYPVFNHVKTLRPEFKQAIDEYMAEIDPNLHIVYRRRKAYDDSVTILNEKLAAFLDKKQEKAQEMFPHYYERYKTDGVEYNLYIGQSLVKEETFDPIYLQNLRLWQLETMCDLEQIAYDIKDKLPHYLRVASLVLIHSNPLSIKFGMDQKQFDVDGAYNARYEIIKKRIDKSHIKGTNERLTQPGKLAIVYSQNKDAQEYYKYLEFLKAEGRIDNIEMLDLEDLQGVSGLKAIRVSIVYKECKAKKNSKKSKKSLEPQYN